MRCFTSAVSGLSLILVIMAGIGSAAHGQNVPGSWQNAWPNTDFSIASVDLSEIRSGGPPRDGIPPVYTPKTIPVAEETALPDNEPVIGLVINGEARAYPLRILIWHEIANDVLGGVPVAVTFCPLCNAAIVFDRRITLPDGSGKTLAFGTTGNLRKSDLVMWDDVTESWWQQFLGQAIVGDLTGTNLGVLPSRLESWGGFKARTNSTATVLVPNNPNMRRYGANPYRSYDSLPKPFLYDGALPKALPALARVVSLAARDRAWSFEYLQQQGSTTTPDGVTLTWKPGQVSALDDGTIADSRDVGTVIATKDGKDVTYFVDFAFAFHAFHPDAPIVTP